MTRRGRPVQLDGQEPLSDMPDRVAKKPPKAVAEPEPMTLDEAITRTFALMDSVIAAYGTGDATTVIQKGPRKGKAINYGQREIAGIYGLYSGGNDSVVLPHLLRRYFDGIIHVNTGTAIRQTTEHVREVVPAAWGLPLHELHPPRSYRELVLGQVLSTRGKNIGRQVWKGFPGPAGSKRDEARGLTPHSIMYNRLKERPLEAFRSGKVGGDGARKKVLYVAGTRWDESDQRFERAGEVTQQGGIVWVAALIHWTNEHMAEYRSRHRCQEDHEHAPHRMCFPGALPLNEVTEHLHMSGDCTCGAKAHEGELDEIRFFYPEKAAEISALQEEVKAAGLAACRWGQRPPGGAEPVIPAAAGTATPFLCAGCKPLPGQDDDGDLVLFTREEGAA
jgi:3'-phosphoadenosine 5'-phosphosulfate sulfotransferase (PAPS reductase)/FAD synthetase